VSVFAVFFIYQVVHQALAQITDARDAARALAYLPIVVVIAMFCLAGQTLVSNGS